MHQASAMTTPTPTEDEMKAQLEALRSFVARRFDELSMEINATSQLLEMGEEDAERRFKNMLGALQSISSAGDGLTSANTGVELEAAVIESERAATTILDAAERIGQRINDKIELGVDAPTQEFLTEINMELQGILLACSFQDLVGQRIRTTITNLKSVQNELSSTLSSLGIDISQQSAEIAEEKIEHSKASSQNDIDALFD